MSFKRVASRVTSCPKASKKARKSKRAIRTAKLSSLLNSLPSRGIAVPPRKSMALRDPLVIKKSRHPSGIKKTMPSRKLPRKGVPSRDRGIMVPRDRGIMGPCMTGKRKKKVNQHGKGLFSVLIPLLATAISTAVASA